MKTFRNKVAVVTGAGGSGIGNALVNELAREGARIAFCDIANLDKTAAELSAVGAEHYHEKVDMSDKQAIDGFIERILARFGHIDLLINNAGIALGDRTFGELTVQDFERITNINYWGVVHTTQRCYPHLLKRPEAAIVNLSSSQGILALPYLVPYCTTKFAVRGFTDSLRAEHALRGIRHLTLHTVHPGRVATQITLNADYHDANTASFHAHLQKGASPQSAARTILKGVRRNTGRIFIADGRLQDFIARLLPSHYMTLVKLSLRLMGMKVR